MLSNRRKQQLKMEGKNETEILQIEEKENKRTETYQKIYQILLEHDTNYCDMMYIFQKLKNAYEEKMEQQTLSKL